ncbi:MAG: TolC family protein [Gammaproteobacteria bacterium]
MGASEQDWPLEQEIRGLARASVVELQALAQRHRVLNDVRIHYYRTLAAKQRLVIQEELLKTAQDQLITVNEMRNVGQANEADFHQATIRLQEQRLNVEMAQNELAMARETLLTMVGVERPAQPVAGTLEGEARPLQWDGLLARLLEESPELAAARAKLEADGITLRREQVEPIPNLVVEGAAGYNFEARETVYGAGLTVEVPLFDWNQGTIEQAKADLRRQQAEVRLTELRLRRALAEQYQRYRSARQHVVDFRDLILPQAEQRYTTQLQSYQADRETWPAVLEAQADFFNRRLAYIDRLIEWREAEVAIEGLLLVNGLEAPPGAAPPGHIDAVTNPR